LFTGQKNDTVLSFHRKVYGPHFIHEVPMKKTRFGIGVLALGVHLALLFSGKTAQATPYSYVTASFSQIYPFTTAPYNQNYYTVNGPSYYSTSGSDVLNGSVLSFNGSAQAARGNLHAAADFSCIQCPSTGFVGIAMQAAWFESGAKAYTIGPLDLLAGVVAYEVSWNLDGTLSQQDDPSIYGQLYANVEQGSYTKTTVATYYAPPVGPVIFYLQPPDPTLPFNFSFQLFPVAGTFSGGTTSGSSDFSNTATFASLEALDANGNVIPGVSLQLSDGTLMGASGFVSPLAPTPEPTPIVLAACGIAFLLFVRRWRTLSNTRTFDW
jgi:hypothetical protein